MSGNRESGVICWMICSNGTGDAGCSDWAHREESANLLKKERPLTFTPPSVAQAIDYRKFSAYATNFSRSTSSLLVAHMSQQDMPIKDVWSELWQEGNYPSLHAQGAIYTNNHVADPILYVTMRSTHTINNALVSLLLLAAFSTAYDLLRLYIGRRTRQPRYSIIDGTLKTAVETPGPGLFSSLARTSHGPRAIVYAKALFHCILFVGQQWILSEVVFHIARAIASTFTADTNVRRECSRLLAQGLECGAAIRYHDSLNISAVIGLLYLIRSLDLHLKVPTRNRHSSRYSPKFLAMQRKARRLAQTILAAPITVVYMHTRVSRQEMWKYANLLLTQAVLSLGIFLVGNLACLAAALPVRFPY
jgi:hypothetical protein